MSRHELLGSNGGQRGDTASETRSAEFHAFLTLACVRGVGHKTLYELAESGRSFASALHAGPAPAMSSVRRLGAKPLRKPSWSIVRAEAEVQALELAERLASRGVSLIFRGDSEFPRMLLDLERPPHWLFIEGALPVLTRPSLAIVGTRKPSEDGLFLARYVGACLADWSAVTVSGLAAGIDQLAHEASLRAGVPTIAILGTGILEDYPRGSHVLRARIVEAGGAIVSEYLPGASYSAENFVQRNRLQAALARVLVPVEWARRSGTAHTVRFATGLGRPIAAMRLSDWSQDRVVLDAALGGELGQIFTLPRAQGAFDRFVRATLGDPDLPFGQLSLFRES